MLRAAVIAAAAWSLSLAIAPGARAGGYHVYSCRTPGGAVAPTDGWSGAATGGTAENSCAAGGTKGALIASLSAGAHEADTDIATWAFAAPASERIAAATLWRAGDAAGGGEVKATYLFWLTGPENGSYESASAFDECVAFEGCTKTRGVFGTPFAAANRVPVPGSSLSPGPAGHLYLNASCSSATTGTACPTGAEDQGANAAVVDLYAADILLEDSLKPAVEEVGGPLASQSTLSGTSSLALRASDAGSGLYEAIISVDGVAVQSTVLEGLLPEGERNGRCAPLGADSEGHLEFTHLLPCPKSANVNIPFDTSALSDGSHHVVVVVEDAAGNSTVALERQITVANVTAAAGGVGTAGGGGSSSGAAAGSLLGLPTGGLPNGAGASASATLTVRWQRSSRQLLASRYGQVQRILGRLAAPGGAPISGALIDLSATPAYAGAAGARMASVRTDAAGRFTVRLAAGASSRTIRLAYRDRLDSVAPVVMRTLRLAVHAGLLLTVTPHTSSVGHTITFRGVLRGGPIPAGGKQLILEARSGSGAWLQFRVIRTDAHGRYHSSYRFRLAGPITYQFRVLCGYEPDFPFLSGTSNVVGVFER